MTRPTESVEYDVQAVLKLLERVLGGRQSEFSFSLLAGGGLDGFEFTSEGGLVEIRGGTTLAACRGVYEYLKSVCHVQVSWSGGDLILPGVLPPCGVRRGAANFGIRYYLSVCTFGYSSVWWDWDRWEREIDWMALHGINMPLALCGQELIWQRVFRRLGFCDEEIGSFFSGPGYLPWHRLGNLDGHLGPLPQEWIEAQARLQHRILDRMRELGMKPVVPGFSGFVPAGFGRLRPDLDLCSAEAWAGFAPTTFVDPRSSAFAEIAGMFSSEYRSEFGEAHHYLCETFAEQTPRFSAETELDDLRAIGRAIWSGVREGDSDARWVMQGWPFYFAQEYWTPERTAALFEAVPEGRLVVLDLATESLETWRRQPTLRAKGWVHSVVHNYGQNTTLQGDLAGFVSRAPGLGPGVGDFESLPSTPLIGPEADKGGSGKGLLLGVGVAPEGLDQNPVVYELLTDLAWRSDRVGVEDWVRGYALSRYGTASSSVLEAWGLLLESVYGPAGDLRLGYSWRYRPGDQPLVARVDVGRVGEALGLLFGASGELASNPLFRRDLVDVCKTWLGALADEVLEGAIGGSVADRIRFFEMLDELDRLMATLPEHRLSTWIRSAREAGGVEADLFERNARSLLTVWGGPVLFDYASREWAGMIGDFCRRRWEMYFAALDSSDRVWPDFAAWEAKWAASLAAPWEAAAGNPVVVVGELLARYSGEPVPVSCEPASHSYSPVGLVVFEDSGNGQRGIRREVSVAESRSPQPPSSSRNWTRGAPEGVFGEAVVDFGRVMGLEGIAVYPVFGQGFAGRYSLEISLDGVGWAPVVDATLFGSQRTWRGARWRFSGEARFCRFGVTDFVGSPDQQFQVVVFGAKR